MSKLTSVEWLFEKLWNEPKDKFTWYSILDEAKEMHKQEIIDAAERWKGTDFAERYYQETFVSKGSHNSSNISDIELPQQEISDNSPKEENKTSYGEISDEEIEKEAKNHHNYYEWSAGAKWYREQLKQRQ